ncbi:MAG: OmpA family protein [Proteobacteria bacterium]|nr:OmpA family protein [Pseudomonadota bacterium]
MSDERSNTPIRIVIKKKGHGGGHHGGAWKVAYADFVTAMMALFIVLWIVGQSNPVKSAISMYFTNPNVFTGGTGILTGQEGTSSKLDLSSKVEVAKKDNTLIEMEKLSAQGKKIEGIVSSNPVFEKFKDKVQISVTKDGMKIELIEDSKGLFFDIGSAKVKPETIKLLKMIATEIGKLPNKVIIEGYTDARPYETHGYSNWELSADRANAARKLLEENGLRKDQVSEVRGYADRNLKQPDKPFDYANRRVNIVVAIPKNIENTSQPTPANPGKEK